MPKSLQTKIQEQRQYRALQNVTISQEKKNRFNSDHYVEGYAMTFEKYKLYEDVDGPVYEIFERNIFDNADMSDVIFQYNHEGRVYARMSNNTLAIEFDSKGMKIMADLSKSQEGRNLFEEIQNGLTTKMSWGFRFGEMEYDAPTRTIIHKSVKKIYDVSAVSLPANDGTSISARSLVEGEIEKFHQECDKRKRLKLLIDLQINDIKSLKTMGE